METVISHLKTLVNCWNHFNINKAFVPSQVYFPYHSITYYYCMRFTTIFAGLFEGYW